MEKRRIDIPVCEDCGTKEKLHYRWFCPKCDTTVLKKEVKVVGDLFKIMYHMEAHGYMSKNQFWNTIIDNIPGNDCYIDLYLEGEGATEVYYEKVAELLGVEYGDRVTMWVSW